MDKLVKWLLLFGIPVSIALPAMFLGNNFIYAFISVFIAYVVGASLGATGHLWWTRPECPTCDTKLICPECDKEYL